jgi:DNA modification methylase
VLDPFFGAGTVGVAAEKHGRDWLRIELSPAFVAMAQKRIEAAPPAQTAHAPPAAA